MIQNILKLIGITKSDEDIEDTYDCDEEPLPSYKKARNWAPLFTIYEENGEDAEYEVCFESYLKTVQILEVKGKNIPGFDLLPYNKKSSNLLIKNIKNISEFVEDKKSEVSASTKCATNITNEKVEEEYTKEMSDFLLTSGDETTRASNATIEIFGKVDSAKELPKKRNYRGSNKISKKRNRRGKSSDKVARSQFENVKSSNSKKSF